MGVTQLLSKFLKVSKTVFVFWNRLNWTHPVKVNRWGHFYGEGSSLDKAENAKWHFFYCPRYIDSRVENQSRSLVAMVTGPESWAMDHKEQKIWQRGDKYLTMAANYFVIVTASSSSLLIVLSMHRGYQVNLDQWKWHIFLTWNAI